MENAWEYFSENIYAPLAVALSVCGVIANIVCVIVLNRPQMKSPMNFLLTCLATADGMGLAIQACIITYEQIETDPCHSENFEILLTSFRIISGMLLASNSWLTVGIAISRYFIISSTSSRKAFSMKKAKVIVLVAFVVMLLEHLGFLIVIKVKPVANSTCYLLGQQEWIDQTAYSWSTFAFSFISVSLLLIFSALLVMNLLRFTRLNNRNCNIQITALQERRNHAKNTTRALLAMAVFAFLTESPMIIYTIYEEYYKTGVLWYDSKFSTIWKIFLILNGGMHIVFLCISKDFRNTLKNIAGKKNTVVADTSTCTNTGVDNVGKNIPALKEIRNNQVEGAGYRSTGNFNSSTSSKTIGTVAALSIDLRNTLDLLPESEITLVQNRAALSNGKSVT